MRALSFYSPLGIILLLALVACSPWKSAAPSLPPVHPEPPVEMGKPADGRENQIRRTRESVRRSLAAANYLEALRVLAAAGERGLPAHTFRKDYARALAGAVADGRSLLEKNPGGAGLVFGEALKHFPEGFSTEESGGITAGQVQEFIDTCSRLLMAEGLEAYRQGRLEQAIESWQEILRFAPDHAEAARFVKTSTLQLKNLQEED